MENARSILLEHGIKLSYIRLLIMKYMLEHKTHPTVDRIFQDLLPENPTLSKTTVYNTLKLLLEEGVINAIGIDEKTMHFDGDLSSHDHFRCRKCGCILDVPAGVLQYPDAEIIGDALIEKAQVYYYGLCGKCRTELENEQ